MDNKCCICTIIKKYSSNDKDSFWNSIILESNNFVALPSIGSLVEGWLLIIPKKHYLCFGALEESLFKELESFKSRVTEILNNCYGPILIFEHGPAKPNQKIGCGVDHAHLHLLPLKIDLFEEIRRVSNLNFNWKPVNEISSLKKYYKNSLPYLYIESNNGLFVATHNNIQSQLIRKAIANFINKNDKYDWKKYYFKENIKTTLNKISTYKSKYNNILISKGA